MRVAEEGKVARPANEMRVKTASAESDLALFDEGLKSLNSFRPAGVRRVGHCAAVRRRWHREIGGHQCRA